MSFVVPAVFGVFEEKERRGYVYYTELLCYERQSTHVNTECVNGRNQEGTTLRNTDVMDVK